jgi:hypothetical protein
MEKGKYMFIDLQHCEDRTAHKAKPKPKPTLAYKIVRVTGMLVAGLLLLLLGTLGGIMFVGIVL